MTHVFPTNPFRTALAKQGRPLVGIWSVLNSSNVVEGLAHSGFDWMLIDNEHAPTDLGDTLSHLRAIAGSDTAPIVRLPWNDPVMIKKYLDIGAQTLMLPFVQSVEEAKAAVAATRYAPQGHRGIAMMHRASRYGRIRDYIDRANDERFLIVQIETPTALDVAEDIAAVEGVDAVFFGPGDLSTLMGHRGNPTHQDVLEAMEAKCRLLHKAGKTVGILAPNAEAAERFIQFGFDFVSVATDGAIIFNAADGIAARFVSLSEANTAKEA
ncbi:HpcH/HpaI aldolase family protein [Granulosicoccus antarcticus]|uniref:4-hydroxy-2-oxo-heptane-1,7-dioate aldolase n=1 Tax=Granulosicoccus antarcticus IMCC3135 TaxID=1192854 RepID=A0A2Z2NTZ9_9GAMM|nr:HpcH/HpaI aldolase/citrate lyase family protein [Granulosicoccus antarcticus]ASJ73218.1 4-hydroxy-2-oxo-heptane-1,7-dioate aldolase [Granulosicoccus antarcticus IMCC3135]